LRVTPGGRGGRARSRVGGTLIRCALGLGLALLPVPGHAADTRTLVDGAGRRVEVPARVERVYAAGGPATIFLYALAPGALLGWTRPLTPEEQAFIPAPYAGLPVLGRLTGRGNTASVEVVLAARPHVILDYGVVNPTYVALADRVQQQTGVPYLLYDGGLSAMPRALEQAGDLLGVRDHAARLARYAEGVLRDVDARLARVPPERRPRVYYARGPRGLETATRGAINVEGIERLGARNVAGERPGSPGTTAVSPEQVLGWDPEVIITIDPAFFAAVRTDPVWRNVRAVRDGRVHLAPPDPFPWVDSPPSVNRLIGLRWLGRVLYPDLFPEDLRQETRAFYALFYHRAPDDRQLDALLAGFERGRP
jgi:iron complex transport system substrate-binding protein